jgi:hypothetical protein
MKRIAAALIIALALAGPACAQQKATQESAPQAQPMPFMSDPLFWGGLITSATGVGLFIAGGAVAPEDLDVALGVMQVSPLFTIAGEFVLNASMDKAAASWQAKGVSSNDALRGKAKQMTFIGAGFGAAGFLLPFFADEDEPVTLNIAGVLCGAVSHTIFIYNLYLNRMPWYQGLGQAIGASGVE